MSFSTLDEIYKMYNGNDINRNTEEGNKYYNELFDILTKILSLDLQNKAHDLINNYSLEVEERSFKDGFKYGINLFKELQ